MTPAVLIPPSPPATFPIVPATLAAPLLTAQEFFAQYETHRVELIKGIVKEMPMPDFMHGRICYLCGRLLGDFIEKADLGRVASNDSFVWVRKNPDTIYGADVCYISYERLPRGPIPKGLLDVVPELVAEVRSPSNTWTEMIVKVGDYLLAGVQVVIVIDPPTESIAVYRPEILSEIFRKEQELVVPDLLPGFAVPVNRFFE
jgi:Uma2 family endonuclease